MNVWPVPYQPLSIQASTDRTGWQSVVPRVGRFRLVGRLVRRSLRWSVNGSLHFRARWLGGGLVVGRAPLARLVGRPWAALVGGSGAALSSALIGRWINRWVG